jgi:hypothetical protein
MNLQKLPRREFLVRALAACGAPFLAEVTHAEVRLKPGTTYSAQKTQPKISPKRGAQVATTYFGVGEVDALKAIGTAYLKQLGVEPTEEAILAAAADTLELIARASTAATAVTALVQAVRRDFREQRSVQLEGWIISRTEAQLCALSLLPDAL